MLPLQMTNRVNQTGDRFCRKVAEQCKCNPEGFDVTEYVFFLILFSRKVRRYQRGNQKACTSKERQYKVKGQKVKAYNDLQNTTNKTREGLSNTTPLNNWE